MNQKEIESVLELHTKWLNREDRGVRADLRNADLRGADLYNTCLPLWCGGLNIKLDRLQVCQLLYHVCSMQCEDAEIKALQRSLYKYANEFADGRDDLRDKKFEEDQKNE